MYFDAQNNIVVGTPSHNGDKYYLYASIELLAGDGTNGGVGNLSNGVGPVTLNQKVPEGAIADKVFAVFNVEFSTAVVNTMIGYIQAFEDFGLRYDVNTTAWTIIAPADLNSVDPFSLSNAGNTSGTGLDSSWMIYFQTLGQTYTVFYRGLNYVFSSVKETNFYYDNTVKVFDPKTGLTIYDQIKVLKMNSEPDSATTLALDYLWYIYKNIIEVDGYENPNRIYVTFPDNNNDGIPDNPELFELLVAPSVNTDSKYVYFQATYTYEQ